jgi:polysaccharide biosynthesis protein PslG
MFYQAARLAFALLLAAILSFQFWSQRAARPLHLPEQQRVETNNPKIGVHTRLAGYGDEGYTARTLEQVREMGAGWVVELFPWAYAQPRSRHGYDWAGFDLVVQHAERQGLTVVARLDLVPAWARPGGTGDRLLDEDHYDEYAEYVAAFLTRYRPHGVRHVIIWNEPNLAFEWGGRRPDPAAYAALLREVYPRAKAAVPDAVVLAGGLAPVPDAGDGTAAMNDLEYLNRLYAAGAGPFFDMLAAHSYGLRQPPEAPPDPAASNFRRVELLRSVMAAHGDAAKTVMITEGGWNDSPRWVNAVLPSQRLRWTVEAYAMAKQWDWLEAMCLWQFATPWSTHTYQDNWSFVAPDGTPKAIYWAVQDAARKR